MADHDTVSRRRFLTAAGVAALAAALPGCTGTTGPAQGAAGGTSGSPPAATFPQLPVLASRDGLLEVDMRVVMATLELDGKTFTTRTYGGRIGGPTLRLKPGDTLKFNLINDLPPNPDQDTFYPDHNTPNHFNSTNNHTHGWHVSPSGNSDNVFVEVLPGETFPYEYHLPADHPAGTNWYHPHRHGSASEQLFGGMAGALIVEGPLDEVPEIAAAQDFVFMFQEINIDPETGTVPDFVPPENPLGDVFPVENRTLVVNGLVNPVLTCRPGEVVRLRILNAAPETFLLLALDRHSLHKLAWDGNTLPQVQETSDPVQVAPGNRLDVLVRAGAPGVYSFRKLTNSFTYSRDPEVIIATMVVAGDPVEMQLPTSLPWELPDITDMEITGQRTVTFGVAFEGGPLGPPDDPLPPFLSFNIDGVLFDPEVVNQTVQLGAVEEWTIQNTGTTSGHPFHIHINPFQVVSINGVPLPRPEWRDTIFIPQVEGQSPGTVVIRSRFLDFTGSFVLHCHILSHEDIGMMQTVEVVE